MRTEFYFLVGVVLLAARGASAADAAYRAPRLPDGRPDLQGTWAHTNMVPLERSKEHKTLAISAEEAKKIEAIEEAKSNDLTKPNEPADTLDERRVRPIHGQLRSSIIVEPEDGQIPGTPLFNESKARAGAAVLGAFDGPEQRPLSERCLVSPNSSPPVLLIPANDLRQIVQTRDTIVISSEPFHDTRIIRINGKHTPSAIVSWTGDSIGWWAGETLVIETTQFIPSLVGHGSPYGLYFVSPQTVVTEKLTRISKDEILYAFSVEDPAFYQKPWRGETIFTLSADLMYAFDCHEGNYSLPNALYGERVKEAAANQKQEGSHAK